MTMNKLALCGCCFFLMVEFTSAVADDVYGAEATSCPSAKENGDLGL